MDHAHPDTTPSANHSAQGTHVEPAPPIPLPFEHASADQLVHLIREGHDPSDLTRLILTTAERAA